MKEMSLGLNPFSLHKNKHSHLILKLVVLFLFLGLAFRLWAPDSFRFSSFFEESTETESQKPLSANKSESSLVSSPVPQALAGDFQAVNESRVSNNAKCDLFMGEWVRDPSGPLYTNESCRMIEDHQNCMRNGRPDTDYLYWRWNPQNCKLPKFDPERFLDLMRNKSWAFVGDSISRNHVQSLLCILNQVEPAAEVYHDEEYKSKRWHFPSHNFTLSVIWTPFLLKSKVFEDNNGVSSSDIQLYLDKLDPKWTEQYSSFDYMVIAGGKWFLKTAIYYENDKIQGCHYCSGKNLTEFGFDHAYRKAIRLVLRFITNSENKAFVFFRTTTPDHFENGEWFSGGTCKRTKPFKNGEVGMRDVDSTMRDIEMEEFEKARYVATEKGVVLRLLDTTQLSLLRPDGHPGPYRQFQPFAKDKNAKVQNDCLHWCLPGPIDSWNDLVMQMVGARENR